jgi:hypothetical protein
LNRTISGSNRKSGSGVIAALVFLFALFAGTAAARADLTNTAEAIGTPAKGALTAPTDTVSVPVAAPAPGMELLKTVTAARLAKR